MHFVLRQVAGNRVGFLGGPAVDRGQVVFFRLGPAVLQSKFRRRVFRKEEDPRRFAVEPMDDEYSPSRFCRTGTNMIGQDEVGGLDLLRCRGDGEQAGRLVHHQNIRVLVKDQNTSF